MNNTMYEERTDRAQRFAEIWWRSRADGRKSQEFMAMGLGVSKKTVQNWEKGTSSPNFFQGSEWFRLLHMNPMPYYLSYLYPWLFTDEDEEDDAKDEERLIQYIKHATPREKKQLLYLIAGHHGSSWFSLLQLFSAHCHTSMQSRVIAARIIKENYEMDEKTGDLVCPDEALPRIVMLETAILQGKQAVVNREKGYSSFPSEQDE